MATETTRQLYKIAKEVSRYLRLDENLFFCAGHTAVRINEGRKYFCYIARKFEIPVVFIRKFLHYANPRTVKLHAESIRTALVKRNVQITIDIETIIKKCQ